MMTMGNYLDENGDFYLTKNTLNLPVQIKPVMLLPIGYTADTFKPAPRHTEYRDPSTIITEL